MNKLKTKWFSKWASKNKLSSKSLCEAIKNVENELSSVDLGANLFKVRVAREGSGKRSGFRTLLVYRENDRAIFLYGFAKNEQENINGSELAEFKEVGKNLLSLTEVQLQIVVENEELFKIEELK